MIIQVFSAPIVRRKFAMGKLPVELENLVYGQKEKLWEAAMAAPLSFQGAKFAEQRFDLEGKTYNVVFSPGKPWDESSGTEHVEQLWILRIEELPPAGEG